MDGVDKNYLWVKGNDKFRYAFCKYSLWIKQSPLSYLSWFIWISYKEHRDGKVLHLTLFGFNFAYLFNEPLQIKNK